MDTDALPQSLVEDVRAGRVDLSSPATTLALMKLNAVAGLTGFFNADGSLKSVGIQCALCHSTVDDSFQAPGVPAGSIGQRLDGWANRDLNVGDCQFVPVPSRTGQAAGRRSAKGGGKSPYSNNIHYDHSSTLKTLEEIFGVEPLLGAAADPHTNDLSDLF